MSVRVMSLVWENEDLDPYERLVMLSLADHADDEGICYPSISRLCKRTGMKGRGVQNVLRRLREKGLVSVDKNGGRKGANLYTLTPALNAPRIECTPASDAPLPPHPITCTPAPGAPEPSITINETSFSEFWDSVPRKVGKDAAEKSYRKALKKTDPETLLSAMKRYAKTREGQDPQYTVHPATWLNQGRWQDELPQDKQEASAADLATSTAKLIKSGRLFLCRSISDQRAHQLLTDGYVTLSECHAVGLLRDMKETA